MDEEVLKMQTELISEKAYQKLQNQFENNLLILIQVLKVLLTLLARY